MRRTDESLRVVFSPVLDHNELARWREAVLVEEGLTAERVELPHRIADGLRVGEILKRHVQKLASVGVTARHHYARAAPARHIVQVRAAALGKLEFRGLDDASGAIRSDRRHIDLSD